MVYLAQGCPSTRNSREKRSNMVVPSADLGSEDSPEPKHYRQLHSVKGPDGHLRTNPHPRRRYRRRHHPLRARIMSCPTGHGGRGIAGRIDRAPDPANGSWFVSVGVTYWSSVLYTTHFQGNPTRHIRKTGSDRVARCNIADTVLGPRQALLGMR